MAVEGISDWWDKAKNDAESVYHAIRHAAATVTKMVTTWSATSTSGPSTCSSILATASRTW